MTYSLEEKKLRLSQAFFEQQTPAELVSLAAALLNNPVMLLDNTYQCLACCPHQELGFPSWDAILAVGHMRKDLVIDMGRYFTRMTDEQRQGAYIFELTEPTGQLFRKIVSGIGFGEQVLGGIAVAQYSQPFEAEDLAFCDYLCKVLGFSLYKETNFQKMQENNVERLFLDLLSKNLPAEVLEGRLEALGLPAAREPYYLVCLDLLPAMRFGGEYIRAQIKERFPGFFTVAYEHHLLMVGSLAAEAYAPVLEKLERFMAAGDIYAAVSGPFHSLTSLKEHYALARQACLVGQKLSPATRVFEFKNLSLQCLLQEVAGRVSLQNYLSPAIRVLKAYDKENGADYRNTLITYLENNFNTLLTANQLFIHRNTLAYRLKKISQLLNVSLDDKNVCVNLWLAHLYDELLSSETPPPDLWSEPA